MVSNHPNLSEQQLSEAVTNETLMTGAATSGFIGLLCKHGKHTFRDIKSVIKPLGDAVEAAVGALVAVSSAGWLSLDLVETYAAVVYLGMGGKYYICFKTVSMLTVK